MFSKEIKLIAGTQNICLFLMKEDKNRWKPMKQKQDLSSTVLQEHM